MSACTDQPSATMSPTVIRGFREAYGSWKMIWTSRRYCLSARPPILASPRSLRRTEPPVGFSSATSNFETVDLPQPDSPTSPSVSPRRSVRFTPSTARTWPTVRLKTIPWVSGKYFFRSLISSSGAPGGGAGGRAASASGSSDAAMLPELSSDTQDLLAVVAGRLAAGDDQAQRRPVPGAVAPREGLRAEPATGAAGVEGAAGRDLRQVRRLTGDRLEPASLDLDLRHGAHQTVGVRVGRVGEDVVDRPPLDDPPGVHDRHVVGHLVDHAEVVGDEHQAHPRLPLEVLQQVHDLGLDGRVQGGGRLVGDEDLRVERDRHRDHHALPHAAGELVRIVVHPLGRGRDAHAVHELDGLLLRLLARHAAVRAEHLADLEADAVHGVQRGEGVLEDHRDPGAADLALLLRREGQQVAALEPDLAVR